MRLAGLFGVDILFRESLRIWDGWKITGRISGDFRIVVFSIIIMFVACLLCFRRVLSSFLRYFFNSFSSEECRYFYFISGIIEVRGLKSFLSIES